MKMNLKKICFELRRPVCIPFRVWSWIYFCFLPVEMSISSFEDEIGPPFLFESSVNLSCFYFPKSCSSVCLMLCEFLPVVVREVLNTVKNCVL